MAKPLSIFIAAGIVVCVAAPSVTAQPDAKFWISMTDAITSVGPEAPVINAAEGKTRHLHIWAQPESGRILQNFSLNLVTTQPLVDFLDGSIKVHNPTVNNTRRFQFVSDSTNPTDCLQSVPSCLTTNASASQVIGGTADGIGIRDKAGTDIQGFSISADGFAGIGDLNDPLRVNTGSGPAWLVASVAFRAVKSTGSTQAYLRIGYNGMIHRGDQFGSADTDVVFGVDPNGAEPSYNAKTERQADAKIGDDPDIIITAVPFVHGDYNGDGTIGPQDFANWRATFGQQVTVRDGADGNSDGFVDAADYVIWRKFVNDGAQTSIIIPEPSSLWLLFLGGIGPIRLKRKREPLRKAWNPVYTR